MTTKPFDQFNKRLFEALLSPFGQVVPNMAVPGEERAIDVFFTPDPGTVLQPSDLGCLARMVDKAALLEPFRSQLADAEVCNCLLKLFLVHAQSQRQVERDFSVEDLPRLWILAASVSDRLIADFRGAVDETWGEGFYFLAPRLRTAIVAIAELPSTPDTLWLRLLGRGRTQEDAIAELLLLPESDPKRSSALSLLVSWRISIEVMEQYDNEDRRVLMALSQAYQEWEQQTQRRGREQGLQQGLEQGLEQGLQQERRATIFNLMGLRFGAVDGELEAIIPALMELPPEDYTRLLLQRSREELLQQFAA